MSERRAYLDQAPGETRGVVTLDGAPERLILRREGEAGARLGATYVARVRELEPALATAFLDLGDGEAILPYKPDARPVRGAAVQVEIRGEARRGKLAVARLLGDGEGPPRLLTPEPPMEALLRMLSKQERVETGALACAAADEAEAEVLETLHPLPGGGVLAIEPTRALTAVDIDVGERKGADSKRVARQANLAALQGAARLLRLKGLGGLVIVDLVGRGHDGAALMAAARAAFAPDNPGVAIGPVGRFGTMEISLPRRVRPLAEQLCDEAGRLSPLSAALRMLRRLEAEAKAQPGARFELRCEPATAGAAEPAAKALAARIGGRFTLHPDPSIGREAFDVRAV